MTLTLHVLRRHLLDDGLLDQARQYLGEAFTQAPVRLTDEGLGQGSGSGRFNQTPWRLLDRVHEPGLNEDQWQDRRRLQSATGVNVAFDIEVDTSSAQNAGVGDGTATGLFNAVASDLNAAVSSGTIVTALNSEASFSNLDASYTSSNYDSTAVTYTATSVATPSPTPQPSAVPTPQPSPVPSPQPSSVPTLQPTALPTLQPTALPTSQPSSIPTLQPSPVGARQNTNIGSIYLDPTHPFR